MSHFTVRNVMQQNTILNTCVSMKSFVSNFMNKYNITVFTLISNASNSQQTSSCPNWFPQKTWFRKFNTDKTRLDKVQSHVFECTMTFILEKKPETVKVLNFALDLISRISGGGQILCKNKSLAKIDNLEYYNKK